MRSWTEILTVSYGREPRLCGIRIRLDFAHGNADYLLKTYLTKTSKMLKWWSLWCSWSKVSQHISGPHNVEFWFVYEQYIIGVPVGEIVPRCLMFLFRWEQSLYRFCFVWTKKDVGEKRGTIRAPWNADCLLEHFFRQNDENVFH